MPSNDFLQVADLPFVLHPVEKFFHKPNLPESFSQNPKVSSLLSNDSDYFLVYKKITIEIWLN